MPRQQAPDLQRRLREFCRVRVDTNFPPREAQAVTGYLLNLAANRQSAPLAGNAFAWEAIAKACVIPIDRLIEAQSVLLPGLLALAKAYPVHKTAARVQKKLPRQPPASPAPAPIARRKPGPKPAAVVEFPEASPGTWEDPPAFADALAMQLKRHNESGRALLRAILSPAETFDHTTLYSWKRGEREPQSAAAMAILARIERRYRLPAGYFKSRLAHPGRATVGQSMPGIRSSERRRLAWHLPDNFDSRPVKEQEEILSWVRRVVVSGSTDYRRYQAVAAKSRFAFQFAGSSIRQPKPRGCTRDSGDLQPDPDDPRVSPGTSAAPTELHREMDALIKFKSATLTAVGYQRNGVWGEETAAQKVEHLGLLFGALAASPRGAVRGHGADARALAMGHLAFPAVWDWYVQWREGRRGFYTAWEVNMLSVAGSLTRKDTGWLRQTPSLANRLSPLAGLVSQTEIEEARADWDSQCERLHRHVLARSKEIKRVSRVHRDPFEPILAVLEADSPVAEYRKIADEVIRLMPDERRHPIPAAEATRGYLMLRLGLHLGLRQKNLRQLLVCPRRQTPLTERRLVELKRGEVRWSEREGGWEVFIPAAAFKNSGSSFFGSKPFRLILPNLAGLYERLEAYIDRHRHRLLRGMADPGTLFVKTVGGRCRDAAYDQVTFYEAWRSVIQRYGIYNPYTGRGAIPGLLPHGPHNIRDVLATHILKKTGSYEQASYAIQDTPDMVAQHYGRFLPQDKAAIAAKILNTVWDDAASSTA